MSKIEKIKRLMNLKHYIWLFNRFRPYSRPILVLASLTIVSSLMVVVQVILSKQMLDLAIGGSLYAARYYIGLFILSFIFTMGINYYMGISQVRLSEQLMNIMQHRFMAHYYRVSWLAAQEKQTGEILTHLTNDVSHIVGGVIGIIPGIAAMILQFIFAFVTLMMFDPFLAVISFVLAPFSVLINFIWGKKLKRYQKASMTLEGQYRSYLNELVQNLLIIKTFEYQEGSLKKLSAYQKSKFDLRLGQAHLSEQGKLGLSLASRFGYIIAFIYGAGKLSSGTASFGTFSAFLQLVGQVQMPLVNLATIIPQLMMVMTSVERMNSFENLPTDAPDALPTTNDTPAFKKISLKGASFSYAKTHPVLRHVDLEITNGSMTALLGPSGSGKTTLIRLLLALVLPQSGTLDLVTASGSLDISVATRSYFTYVPQGNTLFSGTVRDNLILGNPDNPEEAQIELALKTACAYDFVQDLDNGLDTPISEHASDLSEGQAQRLCIARALLRPAPILILDEATSALDNMTEVAIIENLTRNYVALTCIAITHRTTILDYCDQIYQIQDYQVVAYAHEKKL